MSKIEPSAFPLAAALRAEGFVPLPRLWVKGDHMPEIHAIAERSLDELNAIRSKVATTKEQDAAWAAHQQSS